MGACAEWSSSQWICVPKITSDSEWFLWNTNSIPHRHPWSILFLPQCFFPMITSQKYRKSLSHHWKSQTEARNHSGVWMKQVCHAIKCYKGNLSYFRHTLHQAKMRMENMKINDSHAHFQFILRWFIDKFMRIWFFFISTCSLKLDHPNYHLPNERCSIQFLCQTCSTIATFT